MAFLPKPTRVKINLLNQQKITQHFLKAKQSHAKQPKPTLPYLPLDVSLLRTCACKATTSGHATPSPVKFGGFAMKAGYETPQLLRKGTLREGGLGWPAMSWGEIGFFAGFWLFWFLFFVWKMNWSLRLPQASFFFNGCSDKDGLLWKMVYVPVLSQNYTPDFGSAYLSIWNISELTLFGAKKTRGSPFGQKRVYKNGWFYSRRKARGIIFMYNHIMILCNLPVFLLKQVKTERSKHIQTMHCRDPVHRNPWKKSCMKREGMVRGKMVAPLQYPW